MEKMSYFSKKVVAFALLFFVYVNSFAQFVTRATSPLYLSFDELKVWTTTGSTASAANVSTVPMASRFNDLSAQINPNQSYNLKVDWTVDGVDRWSNYMNEVNKFNTYNFVNWSYIDKFTWFSNAANGVFIPPKPFIDAAHKNGVKIVGTVMIGSSSYYTSLLTNTNGDFPAARKLVEIAKYYGFDGYLFNMEASTSSANAALLQNLLKQIQSLKTPTMDISWYDSLTSSGTVSYQDAMNTANVNFMQSGGTVSNSFFSNYNWQDGQITTSVNTANNYGISPFNVYIGVDAWTRNAPNGYLYNKNFMNYFYNSGNLASPKLSVVLYAFGNLIYEPMTAYNGNTDYMNLPSDWAKYYDGEAKFMSGDDINVNTTDSSWKGMGYYMPARSVINTLPFETNFNIGQGKIWSVNGVQTTRDWSDAGKQEIMPTWQWSVTGSANIVPRIDCDLAYNGGSSIKLTGSINNNDATVKLYLTQLSIANNTQFDVTYKTAAGATNAKLLLYFSGAMSTPVELDLGNAPSSNWETKTFDLGAHAGKTLSNIGIKVGSASNIASYQLNLGKFKVYNQTVTVLPGAATNVSPTNAQTQVDTNTTLTWTAGSNAASHDVYFGTDPNNLVKVGNQTTTTYAPANLQNSTTYYWRIDEKNAVGTTTGTVWSFTTAAITLPAAVTYVSPANAATNVTTPTALSWNASNGATSYDVYFGTNATNLSLVSNQTSLTYTPQGLSNNNTYYWRVDGKNAAGTVQGQVWSFNTTMMNLALNKSTTVSSTESGTSFGGSLAVDGNASTRWSSNYTNTEWIVVDLQNTYNINKVNLTWEAAYGKDFNIEISNDGTNWTTLKNVTGNTSLSNSFTNLSGVGRYIRMIGVTRATNYGYSLYELEVYGTAAALVAPSQASIVSPTNGQTQVSTNTTLNWTAGANTASHNVYFGTDPANLTFVGNQTTTTYTPANLQNNTTYYWRIDEKNATGTTAGSVWSFTTAPLALPTAVTYVSPANASTNQTLATTLNWNAAANATSYDVYFGTNSNSLTLVSNQTTLSYSPQNLANNTAYYWRIDAKNAAGTTQGAVWNFTTVPAAASGNYAISSTSTSSSINAGNVTQMNGVSKLTMEGWAKFNAIGDWNSIMGKASTSLTSRVLLQTTADKRLYVLVGNGTNTYGYTAANVINTGAWYHLAVLYDGTQTSNATKLKLYVNGVQQTLTFSGTIPTSTASNAYNFTAGNFNGYTDEVRVWNAAVTQADIQAWSNKKLGSCHPNYANLVLYWNFDDNSSASTAKACLSTTYSGALTGATYTSSTQAVNPSGCTAAKMTTPMENISVAKDFVIYPNPVTNKEFNIRLSSDKNTEAAMYIYDNSGRLVHSETFKLNSGVNTINKLLPRNMVSNAIYYLRIVVDGGTHDKKIFVK